MARYRVYIDANGKISRKDASGKGEISGLYVYDKSTVQWSVQFYEMNLAASEYQTIDLSDMQSLRINVRSALDDDSELIAFQYEFNQETVPELEDLTNGYVTWEIVFNNDTLESMLDDAQGSVGLQFEITAIAVDGARRTLDQGTLTVYPSLDDGSLGDPPENPGYYMTGDEISDLIDTKVADLVNSSPEALDTLAELSAALNDDPDFAATMTTELANKAEADHEHSKSDIDGLTDFETFMTLMLDSKANSSHTHTLSDITNPEHGHVIADVQDLDTTISSIQTDITTVSDRIGAVEEVLNDKADKPAIFNISETNLSQSHYGEFLDMSCNVLHVKSNATEPIEVGFYAWITAADGQYSSPVMFEDNVTVNGVLATDAIPIEFLIPAYETRLVRKIADDEWLVLS